MFSWGSQKWLINGANTNTDEGSGIAINHARDVVYHTLSGGNVVTARISNGSIAHQQSNPFNNPGDRTALAYNEKENILWARDYNYFYFTTPNITTGIPGSWTRITSRTVNGENVLSGNAWIGADGKYLVIVMQSSRAVYFVDPIKFRDNSSITAEFTVTLNTTPHMNYSPSASVGVSGDKLFIPHGSANYLQVYLIENGVYQGDISVPADNTVTGMAISPDGTLAAYCSIVGSDQWYLYNVTATPSGVRMDVKVEICFSEDGISFSNWTDFDPNSVPQSRFLKFRANFSGGVQEGEVSTFEFDQNKPETKLLINEFLESVSTNIKFKTVYNQPMIQDVSYVDGKLFEATIDKTKWKSIAKLLVK